MIETGLKPEREKRVEKYREKGEREREERCSESERKIILYAEQ